MEVKDFLKGEPISYSLEENLRENLGKQLNIKFLERNDSSFNLIVESAGKEYRVLAIKVNTVKDQWQFKTGRIDTFSKKKLVEGILRDSLPFENRNSIAQSIMKEGFEYDTSEAYTPIWNDLLKHARIALGDDLDFEDVQAFAKRKFVKKYGLSDYNKYISKTLPLIAKEGVLKEKREVAWPIPTAADESYVMLILAIGQAKFVLPALNSLAYFDEKDEQTMVDEGLKVIEGKITAEKYAEKFLSLIVKYNGKKLEKSEESIIKSQVEARVGRNKSDIVNPNMKAAAKKTTKKESILKESESYGQPTIGDDLKANFRDYENDSDNEKDYNNLVSLLIERHPEVDEERIKEIAKDWTGYVEAIEEGVENNVPQTDSQKFVEEFKANAVMTDRLAELADEEGVESEAWGDEADRILAAHIETFIKENNLDKAKFDLEFEESDEESEALDYLYDLCDNSDDDEMLEEGVRPVETPLTEEEESLLGDMDDNLNIEGLPDRYTSAAWSLEKKGYLKLVSAGHYEFLKKTAKAKKFLNES